MRKQWQAACMVADISDYSGHRVVVGSEEVALFRVGKVLYAVGNFDPFSQAHIISRGVVSEIDGRIAVASPVFKQHFDLTTGFCLEDPSLRINVYSVRVRYGLVEVNPTPLCVFRRV
ncbi:nitrite reductase small subunit NirD [Candidatus Sororendozoicomonas aggregata]|uniref:nitrite reductase small subunit NirD n=1 Tax=Candidatus Sororendozoicomonas aggregata TaxID=3073239 RepID=UPI002ED65650